MKKVYFLLLLCCFGVAGFGQVTLYTYGFEGANPYGPTVQGTTVDGWNYIGTTSNQWLYPTSGSNPTCTPHSGTGTHMAEFNSYNISSGGSSICTPAISMLGYMTGTVSFWMYRDNQTTYSEYDSISVYVNTTTSLTGANYIGRVDRQRSIAVPSTATSNTWNQYTFSMPASFNNAATVYVIFKGISSDGYNCYIDDISVAAVVAPPTLLVSPSSLNFGLVQASTASAAQTYTLSGASLTGAPGTLNITAPTNYKIATAVGGPYNTTASISYTSTTLPATPIYVEFVAPATTGTYTGTVTTAAGGGVSTPPGVSLSGISAANCATPTQPQSILLSAITGITATASLTDTYTPTGYIAVASVGALTATPVNATTYVAGNIIGNGTVVATSTTTTLNLTGLTANTAYTITIFPYSNGATCFGPNYNTVSPLTALLNTCLAIPPLPTSSNITTNGFTASWVASPGASNYLVDVSTNNTFTQPILGSPFTVTGTTLTVTGLLNSTNYYCRVTAIGGFCNSAPSPTLTVKTLLGTAVVLSGFNEDVIANGVGSPASSTTTGANGFDFGGPPYVFIAQDYSYNNGSTTYTANGTSYLPNGGLINSYTTTGLPFQLANYTGNNALTFTTGGSGTLTFASPASASTIYMLGTSGSGASTINFTVNFTDGSSQAFNGQSFPDWFTGATIAEEGIGRVVYGTGVPDGNNTSAPYLNQVALALSAANQVKQIDSINVACTSGGHIAIFAASIVTGSISVSTNSVVFPLTNSCGVSAAQIFSVSGVSLYPSNGAITATVPTGFLVSSDGVNFNTTANIAYTGNSMTNTPVYVEFDPAISGGITTGTLSFSGGTVSNAPTVSLSGNLSGLFLAPANTVAAFGNISYQTLAPFPITYSLSGLGLTPGTVTVSVVSSIGNDFQVSQTPTGGLTSSYTLTTGASIAPTPVYVQFTPSIMGAESATVTISGAGQVCTQIINATGTGTVACSQPGAPTTIVFPNTSATGSGVNFAANATPTGYMVLQSTVATTPPAPVTGIVYAPGSAYGSGTVAGNFSSQPPLSLSSQNGNTKYYINIYAFNGGPTGTCGSGPFYAPTALAGSYITCPAAPVVAASGASVSGFTLSWPSCSGGGATPVTYYVEVATDALFTSYAANYPVVVADNVGGTVTANITGLSQGTTYYYRVTALGACNSIAASGNEATPVYTYCTPSYDPDAPNFDGGCADWYASSVVGGGINFSASTGCGSPNQLSQVATVTPGGTLALAVTTQQYSGCGIWIDWNNDGIFEDAENVFSTGNTAAYAPTFTPTISIPAGQSPGNYRMRLIAAWETNCFGSGGSSTYAQENSNSTDGYGPCGTYDDETYEDFTVYIASTAAATSFSVAPTALHFGSTQICNASASQSVTISSASLLPTVGAIAVNAPTGYQIATTSTGAWVSNLSYTYTAGAINSVVWVRLDPSVAGVDTGVHLTFSGGNVNPMPIVALTGTATATPAVQPVAGMLNYCFVSPVTTSFTDGITGGNWASSDAAVASIDNSGNLTTHSEGTTLITYATLTCNILSSVTTTVNVYHVPSSTVTAVSSSSATPTTDCNGVTLTAHSDIANYYTWYRNGTAIATDSLSNYIATTSGTYYVSSMYSVTGCSSLSPTTVITILPHPTASISTPSSSTFGCTNLPMTAVTDNGNQFTWTDNSNTVSAATTYTATTSGTYALTVTNTVTGCQTTATMNVVIDGNPTAAITGSGVPNQLVGCGTLTLTAVSNASNYFTWYQNGVPVQQGSSPTYYAPISGTYSVNCEDLVGGCNNTSSNVVATVNQSPTSVISTPGNALVSCGPLVLTGISDIGTTYEWHDDNNPVSAANPYTATTSGTYYLNSSVSSTGCNTNSTPIVVTINAVPTSVINTPGNALTGCGELVLTAASNSGNQFTWYQDGLAVQQGASNAYIATVTSTYYVNSNVSGSDCNTNSADKVITIYPIPPATITPLGPTSICQGQTVALQANSGGGFSYNWLRDNSITGGSNIVYQAGTSGSYTVIVKDANNCLDTSVAVVITVNPLPVPVVTANGADLSTSGSYAGYQWYYNSGLQFDSTSSSYTAQLNGTYYVVVTDANGCSGASASVVVSGLGISNTAAADNINIYPNPNNGSFTIAGSIQTIDNNIQMEITDVAGQVVMTDRFRANNGIINKTVILSQKMAPGMYLIRLKSDQTNLVWQVVKQ